MSKFKLRRPSPALFISLIALFVALGTGAYAATKIDTGDIRNGAVTTKKIAKQAVNPSRIQRQGVKVNKIAPKAVDSGKIADLAVENRKLLSPTIWAFVNGETTPPTIVKTNTDSTTGAEATGVVRDSEGRYTVSWAPQDPSLSGIEGCLVLATAADVGEKRWAQTDIKGSGPTFSSEVQTRDETGAAKNSKFSTALFC